MQAHLGQNSHTRPHQSPVVHPLSSIQARYFRCVGTALVPYKSYVLVVEVIGAIGRCESTIAKLMSQLQPLYFSHLAHESHSKLGHVMRTN